MPSRLKKGDKVPVFSLPDQYGNMFHLQDLLGKKNLVVYFYPADNSFGCTREACAFRDSYEVFKNADTEVIGISADSVSSHEGFARSHRLPFILLSDPDRKVISQFGIGKIFGILNERKTYVIDKAGTIVYTFDSVLNFEGHAKKALEALSAGKS